MWRIQQLKSFRHVHFLNHSMKKIKLLFTLLFLFLGTNQILAQNVVNPVDTNTYVVIRNNGTELIGKIISDDGREVLLESKTIGKIYIQKWDIKSITVFKPENVTKTGEYREKGPFTTRYQFTTNSFPIEKGDNYAVVNLYGPEVQFAVTNRFSVGVIATWIASPIALALKYTIPTNNPKWNFGLGTLLGSTGYINQGRGFGGLHWGMVTYGNRLNNITFSAGFSYLKTGINNNQNLYKPGTYAAQQDPMNPGTYYFQYYFPYLEKNSSPMVSAPIIGLGGITSVGKKASFVFDAMLLFGTFKSKSYTQDVQNYYNTTGQPEYTVVSDPIETGTEKIKSVNAVIMPGMRFQKSENRAFQISLAGVIGKTDGVGYSFPIPMATWYFKF